MNVTINGFNITAADLDWTGDGASFTQGCDNSYRRNDDSDSAADWADICLASDFGTANSDINLGVDGCLGARTETVVTVDSVLPEVTCPDDLTVVVNEGELYTLPDYTLDATVTDNCTATPTLTQDPAIGTEVAPGTYTITITGVDEAGNQGTCSFVLTVDGVLGTSEVSANSFGLYPNPTSGEVFITNQSDQNIEKVTVMDVHGRTIQTLENPEGVSQVSLRNIASGVYFLNIQTENTSVIKRVVKK